MYNTKFEAFYYSSRKTGFIFLVGIRVVHGTRLIVNFRGKDTCWLKISGARDERLDLLHFWSALKVYKVGLYRAFDCAFRFARKKRSVFPVVLPNNKPRVKDTSLDIFLRPLQQSRNAFWWWISIVNEVMEAIIVVFFSNFSLPERPKVLR